MRKVLSERQEKFICEYAKSGNVYWSAINAGYSENYAKSKAGLLLENERVHERLVELTQKTRSDQIADISEMQAILTKIIRQTAEEECLMSQGIGEGMTEIVTKKKKSALKDVTKAIELLGKMQGAFTDKVEVDVILPVIGGEKDLED